MDQLHSVRLFPKGRGASGYALSGIAACCDWIVLSDKHAPLTCLVERIPGPPRSVFVSLRQPFAALDYFFHQVLPKIHSHFVLITGSEDVTVPTQIDRRWRPFDEREREMLERIRVDRRVLAWFAENLDRAAPKMHPLPTGMVPPPESAEAGLLEMPEPAHGSRQLQVLCCHRLREGDQWEARRQVTDICKTDQSGLCQVIEEELTLDAFTTAVRQHAFVLCVEGGGLDPSPKAWTAIMNGSIPVMRRTSTSCAYEHLPVAFVDSWSEPFLDRQWLESERMRLAPMFDDPEQWEGVKQQLHLSFWWRRVQCFLGKEQSPGTPAIALSEKPLVVVGMHRSGTSLLTALLSFCGANPGPVGELTKANEHNPKGFWENNEFREINDELLRGQDCEWDCPLGFSLAKAAPELLDHLADRARDLTASFKPATMPVFKDPRVCLTFDFWRKKFGDIVPVLMLRDPVEIAFSLYKRNQIPLPIGIALWEFYILSAVRSCRDCQPIVCFHRDVVYSPVTEIKRVVEAINDRCGCGLVMPEHQVIEQFVDSGLHREAAKEDAVRQYLVPDQLAVWSMLQDGELDAVAARDLSPASTVALEGYKALGMQFSRVRHLEALARKSP